MESIRLGRFLFSRGVRSRCRFVCRCWGGYRGGLVGGCGSGFVGGGRGGVSGSGGNCDNWGMVDRGMVNRGMVSNRVGNVVWGMVGNVVRGSMVDWAMVRSMVKRDSMMSMVDSMANSVDSRSMTKFD